jgi:hypothetical protein
MADGWLTGWKAIGKYLGVNWQTVKRWNKKYGFPVSRTPGGIPRQHTAIIDEWNKNIDPPIKNKKR